MLLFTAYPYTPIKSSFEDAGSVEDMIQIAATIYTQARLRTSLFCFLLYQLSLWWVKYRAQPEAIST